MTLAQKLSINHSCLCPAVGDLCVIRIHCDCDTPALEVEVDGLAR
jgi:hypothetical protein